MKTVPDVHSGRLEFAQERPRVLKTHFPRDPRYRRIIHLVRDPRDVIISYFHYSKGLAHLFLEPVREDYALPKFIDLFLRGRIWPGPICEHTTSYTKRPEDVDYTCIRYESLLMNPRQEFPRLLQAAGIAFPEEHIDALCAHTSFTNMRRLHCPGSARAGMVETNPVHILRRGVVGQHKEALRRPMRERIQAELGDYLQAFGYS